jgi:hypothetical protein
MQEGKSLNLVLAMSAGSCKASTHSWHTLEYQTIFNMDLLREIELDKKMAVA